jgi:glycosyltransferase involved in cell wall biosynthesis
MKLTQVLYAGLGGHGSVVSSLIGADQNSVFDHRLIYYGIEPLNAAYRDFCVQKGIPQIAIRKEPGQNRESWKAYRKALEEQQPDIVLLHSTNLLIPSWQYARRKKVRLVVVEHQSNQAKRKSEWLWSFLAMFLAAHIVYLTDNYRNEVRRKLSFFFRPSKTSVIPNGIDTHQFYPSTEPVSGLKIGMCSRINPLRDHETLLRAFEMLAAQYPELELHIAGDGDGFTALKQRRNSSAFSERIFLHGNLREHELIGFLQSLTIYVHSTKAETLSTAILQAMSTRLPLLVSRIPGTANMFADGTAGFFFPPGDPQELAIQLQQLLGNPGLRQELGANARKIAEQEYSEQSMFTAYENLLGTSLRN